MLTENVHALELASKAWLATSVSLGLAPTSPSAAPACKQGVALTSPMLHACGCAMFSRACFGHKTVKADHNCSATLSRTLGAHQAASQTKPQSHTQNACFNWRIQPYSHKYSRTRQNEFLKSWTAERAKGQCFTPKSPLVLPLGELCTRLYISFLEFVFNCVICVHCTA